MARAATATSPAPAAPSPPRRPPSPPWRIVRPGSSILLKVVAALVGAVVVSGAVTELVNTRLTSSVLDRQARELTEGHLSTVTEAYDARERQLAVTLRNLAQLFWFQGLVEPDRRLELIAELGRAAGNLELDVLRLVDPEGGELSPAAGTGPELASTAYVPPTSRATPSSHIVPTGDGRYVQVLAEPVPGGADKFLLVGGYAFGDSFAYDLRRQVGSTASVTLVAGGRVAGTTLLDRPGQPPGMARGGLPAAPRVVDVAGVKNVVAYASVSRSEHGATEGAVGVALPDLLLAVDRTLVQTRLVTLAVLTLVGFLLGWLLFRTLVGPMVGLARTAGRIAGGELDASFRLRRPDEIGVLAESLEQMRLELGSKLELIAQQAADLQESSQRIVAAEDQERHRLARDLHDGIQQQLVVLRMQIGMLEEGAFGGPGGGSEVAQGLGEQLDRAIEQLREVTQDLYPSILLDRGLAAALRTYVARLPVSARLRCEPEELPRLAPEIESAAYFLVCEALTNALKHAGATTIEVSLTLADGWLTVGVRDDGEGFQMGERRGGGLQHMSDRVVAYGGVLDIETSPGQGTAVGASFPDRRRLEESLWGADAGQGCHY